MSWNIDRRIALATLGVTIVGVMGTWLAVPSVYKWFASEPSVDSRRDILAKQEPPAQTQKQVSQKQITSSIATEESEPHSAPKPQKAYPKNFQFLIGEWESMTPGNNWRMGVSWDSQSGLFLGYLTKQGQASQALGFRMGESVWTAEPIDDQRFIERQKLRNGFGNSWWNTQNVDIRESSRDHLSGYVEFKRIQ